MKTIVLVLGVSVLLTCTGCNRPTDDTTAKKVAALEAKVETLEKRNSDLALKGRIVSSQLSDRRSTISSRATNSGRIPMIRGRPIALSVVSRR